MEAIQRILKGVLYLLAAILLTTCEKEPFDEVFFEEEEMLISTYLEENLEDYSTLVRVLELSNLKSTLNAYGRYTFFAPDNEAFEAFLETQGKTSVDQFETDYLINLVRYHLISTELESSYFRDGVIQDTTYSGDHLVVTFSEGGLETIMVNDATITERDIHLENGILHRLDHVLVPIVGSIVDRIEEDGSFTIFSEALKVTGLSDSLDIITIELSEDIDFRSRFTLFLETDETYQQHGIQSVDDLISTYSDTGDPMNTEDGLYRYMAYHILPDLIFLNDIDSFNYPTLCDQMVLNIKVDNLIRLNSHQDEQGHEAFISVLPDLSNKQAKNGTYHVIDKILEPWEPGPTYMIIDLTNFQGIGLGREYTEKEMEDIPWITTENTGIYFRNSILADGETNLQTTKNGVGWEVEFTLPPILRGKYDVTFHWASHGINCSWAQAFWDGARMGGTFSFKHQKRWPGTEWKNDYNTSQYLGRLVLTETESHTIKFVSLMEGYGNFDYLVLEPVGN